jgi:hypothetical protein
MVLICWGADWDASLLSGNLPATISDHFLFPGKLRFVILSESLHTAFKHVVRLDNNDLIVGRVHMR